MFISLLFASYSIGQNKNKQKKKNDWEEMKLKGKVKSVKENYYKAIKKFGKVQKKEKVGNGQVSVFNDTGNIIEWRGDLMLMMGPPTPFFVKKIRKYKYDGLGRVIEINSYNTAGFIGKTTNKYDSIEI